MEQYINMSNANIKLNDYGCFFAEYEGNLCSVYYIKSTLWCRLGGGAIKNMEDENMYIVRIPSSKNSILPIPDYILTDMIAIGFPINDLDIDIFVDLYKKKYDYLNINYVKDCVRIINEELKNISIELQKMEILQKINCGELDNISDISDTSDIE